MGTRLTRIATVHLTHELVGDQVKRTAHRGVSMFLVGGCHGRSTRHIAPHLVGNGCQRIGLHSLEPFLFHGSQGFGAVASSFNLHERVRHGRRRRWTVCPFVKIVHHFKRVKHVGVFDPRLLFLSLRLSDLLAVDSAPKFFRDRVHRVDCDTLSALHLCRLAGFGAGDGPADFFTHNLHAVFMNLLGSGLVGSVLCLAHAAGAKYLRIRFRLDLVDDGRVSHPVARPAPFNRIHTLLLLSVHRRNGLLAVLQPLHLLRDSAHGFSRDALGLFEIGRLFHITARDFPAEFFTNLLEALFVHLLCPCRLRCRRSLGHPAAGTDNGVIDVALGSHGRVDVRDPVRPVAATALLLLGLGSAGGTSAHGCPDLGRDFVQPVRLNAFGAFGFRGRTSHGSRHAAFNVFTDGAHALIVRLLIAGGHGGFIGHLDASAALNGTVHIMLSGRYGDGIDWRRDALGLLGSGQSVGQTGIVLASQLVRDFPHPGLGLAAFGLGIGGRTRLFAVDCTFEFFTEKMHGAAVVGFGTGHVNHLGGSDPVAVVDNGVVDGLEGGRKFGRVNGSSFNARPLLCRYGRCHVLGHDFTSKFLTDVKTGIGCNAPGLLFVHGFENFGLVNTAHDILQDLMHACRLNAQHLLVDSSLRHGLTVGIPLNVRHDERLEVADMFRDGWPTRSNGIQQCRRDGRRGHDWNGLCGEVSKSACVRTYVCRSDSAWGRRGPDEG
eukprot:m.106057 g.106057  ORF g.106057 m.106057 type:complete len:717 (+) comp10573_c1_seq1:349-2499(+)